MAQEQLEGTTNAALNAILWIEHGVACPAYTDRHMQHPWNPD